MLFCIVCCVCVVVSTTTTGGGGGGGSFLACQDFWENVRPLCASTAFFFSFLFKWRLARAHYYIHSLCRDQSTVAQRAETTVTDCSLTSDYHYLFFSSPWGDCADDRRLNPITKFVRSAAAVTTVPSLSLSLCYQCT